MVFCFHPWSRISADMFAYLCGGIPLVLFFVFTPTLAVQKCPTAALPSALILI
jgi:hypothetical protein